MLVQGTNSVIFKFINQIYYITLHSNLVGILIKLSFEMLELPASKTCEHNGAI